MKSLLDKIKDLFNENAPKYLNIAAGNVSTYGMSFHGKGKIQLAYSGSSASIAFAIDGVTITDGRYLGTSNPSSVLYFSFEESFVITAASSSSITYIVQLAD